MEPMACPICGLRKERLQGGACPKRLVHPGVAAGDRFDVWMNQVVGVLLVVAVAVVVFIQAHSP
jgi:hypothetical protein